MAMTNMKMGKEYKDTLLGESPSKMDMPAYPYGLCISLEDATLKKLGIKELPKAGEKMMVHAMVTVDRASSTDTKDGGKQQSLSLQITDMALLNPSEMKEMSEKIYG